VSQLHARAIRRLREALGTAMPAADAVKAMRTAILEFHKNPRTGKPAEAVGQPAVVVPYTPASRARKASSPNSGERRQVSRQQVVAAAAAKLSAADAAVASL